MICQVIRNGKMLFLKVIRGLILRFAECKGYEVSTVTQTRQGSHAIFFGYNICPDNFAPHIGSISQNELRTSHQSTEKSTSFYL